MTGPHDGDSDVADLADITLFGHVDPASSRASSLRKVQTSKVLDPDQLLLSGDGRYELLGMLGRGGAGEVHRVLDRKLNRIVALKLLRLEYSSDAQMIARFTREAQVISQLDHPSIIPIYDLGRADSGRWYLTMKEVHGRTLRECIAAMYSDTKGSDPFNLRQAVVALQRVCTAVGFAHDKGVLHRDLKPDNIMIAEFGQVFVLDWGLARVLRSTPLQTSGITRSVVGSHTDHGLVMGTPAYMSPEQARADLKQIGPASDVWSIGATLYAILYGEPPFSGSANDVLSQVELGPPPVPDCASLPLELVDLWQQCMRKEPEARPSNGTAVADALSLYLEGRKNQEQALHLIDEARAMLPDLIRARDEAFRASDRAHSALRTLRQSDDLETKERAWKQEDLANQSRATLEQEYDRILTKVRMAHDHAPRLTEVRIMLAELYRQRAEEAEDIGDIISAQSYKALVATYDDGRHLGFLQEEGQFLLDWNPRDAQVRISRFELKARRLTPVALKIQELRPGVPRTLPTGSYLFELRAPNRASIKIPVLITPEMSGAGTAPGQKEPMVLELPQRDRIAKQERYVNGGWFLSGGDDRAMASLPRQRLWVEPFLIAARPVSHQEYLVFLNSITTDSPAMALEHSPALPNRQGDNQPLYNYDPVHRCWSLPDQVGDLYLHPTNPVIGVSWLDTRAYLLWLSQQTGLPWRLPSELEWEMAARGTDGRSFPWGEHSDPSFFCHQDTHLEVMGPPATGKFLVDCSPYGVMGLAGGVSDWCADTFHPQGPERRGPRVIRPAPPEESDTAPPEPSTLKSIRGGAWCLSSTHGRCASRSGQAANRRSNSIGFRLCRDSPQGFSKR